MLGRIERINLILGALITAVAGAVWGPRGALAAGVGAGLACADFWLLVRIGSRLVANASAGTPTRGLPFLLFGKTAGLFAAVFVAVVIVRLEPIPFALGFSVFVVSIVLLGLQASAAERQA